MPFDADKILPREKFLKILGINCSGYIATMQEKWVLQLFPWLHFKSNVNSFDWSLNLISSIPPSHLFNVGPENLSDKNSPSQWLLACIDLKKSQIVCLNSLYTSCLIILFFAPSFFLCIRALLHQNYVAPHWNIFRRHKRMRR